MRFDKGHHEFASLDMASGWETPAGYPPGFKQKIVAGALDEKARLGNRTRFLRIEPGAFTTTQIVHDFWEEVLIVEGALHDLRLQQTFTKGMYACRPPGMPHGPWTAPEGCLTFELRYYKRP